MHTPLKQAPLINPVKGAVSTANKKLAKEKIIEKVNMAEVTPANFNRNEVDETAEPLWARLPIYGSQSRRHPN